jgi:hypothetical protein
MKASIRLDHQLLAVESEHTVHAMLELAAPPPADGGTRASLNLGIVIDRSGSMAGPKLETTKQCVEYLVRRLDPSHHLTLSDGESWNNALLGADSTVLVLLVRLETGHAGSVSSWLSCTKSKLDHPTPARDLYSPSPLFRGRRVLRGFLRPMVHPLGEQGVVGQGRTARRLRRAFSRTGVDAADVGPFHRQYETGPHKASGSTG